MLAQCPAFESSGGEFAELGTDRHEALRAHYHGDDSLLEMLDEESQQGIRWAADYIRAHSTDGHPLEWETTRKWTRPDFSEAQGTPDVVNGLTIFDFKWRPRDYTAQMADYALSLIQSPDDVVTVHLLFGAIRRPEVIRFNIDACERIVGAILESCQTPDPRPCDYCNWCSKRLVCPAMTRPAAVVGAGYQEPGLLDFTTWRPSELMENAEQLAFALTLWRRVLKKWGESVEYHAMEAATKRGLKLPGYEIKERQGRKFVSNTQQAYELSGLEPEKFLTACAVRLNTSKTHPDQVGLDKLFADALGIKTAAAKREVEKRLGAVIQRGKPTLALVSVKEDSDEE